MDYQKIKYFLKAAETLNFSEAARQMYITPQSFGKQIALLEEEIGFSLFDRSTRQTQLTVSGQMMYDQLSGIVKTLENEYERICEAGNKRSRQIRIGVFNALSRKKVVTPVVNSILAEYPNQDISIRMCDMRVLKEEIQNGTLDLCITSTHETEPGWANCTSISLQRNPAKVVVSRYHNWFVKDSISVEDMRESNFVKMAMPQFDEKDYFVNIPCKEQLIVDNYENMCFAIEQGNCFSIMDADADYYMEQGGKSFDLCWNPFEFELALIYNNSNTHSFLPKLCQFIQEQFEV